jgi:uncharacterized membrane protein YccC
MEKTKSPRWLSTTSAACVSGVLMIISLSLPQVAAWQVLSDALGAFSGLFAALTIFGIVTMFKNRSLK